MRVVSVIVTYESNIPRLEKVVKIISKQCAVNVVDNSTSTIKKQAIKECVEKYNCKYVAMEVNCGIGAAQNRGINLAMNLGADAVLLLDDDSVPEGNLIKKLVACSESFNSSCVISSNVKNEFGREIANVRKTSKTVIKYRDMMSSGTLIPVKIYKEVGAFNEKMFIDCVDFEWGWRAQKLGIKIFLCKATSIEHRLGAGIVFGIKYPTPLRHYYQYRNIIRMILGTNAPILWRLSQAVKILVKPLVIILFLPEKIARLKYLMHGVKDAISQKDGHFQEMLKN